MSVWQLTKSKLYALKKLGRVCLFVKKPKPSSIIISHLCSLKQFSKKISMVVLMSIMVTSSPSQAGMFDSLLKILLPFYKGKEDSKNSPPPPVHESPDEQTSDTPSPPNDVDIGLSPVDDLGIPSILLDDTLSADDATPMLDEPDLYALLSAEFYADRGDIAQALSIYKAESFKRNATTVFERALALSIEYEDPIESLHFATAWQMINTDHIPAWFYVAHLALKARDYNQATQMIAMILQYDNRADLTQILTGIFPTDRNDQRSLFVALQELEDEL